MDKSLIVKLKNYFSDRIEEIKDGNYIPTYEQIKELPEFNGISWETFRIARKHWYSQHFGMSFRTHSKRLGTIKVKYISNNGYDKKLLRKKRNTGFCFIIPGALFLLGAFSAGAMGWSYQCGIFWLLPMIPATFLLVIGIILIVNYSIKEKRNKLLMGIIIGLIIVILGVILIVIGLIAEMLESCRGFSLNIQGILLLSIGILLTLYSISKARKL